MTDIEHVVANRLRAEAYRKGLRVEDLAQEAQLRPEVVQEYFNAKRTIDFKELRPLCEALSVSIVSLARPNFPRANLSYRDTGTRDRRLAGEIEYGFLQLREFIHPPQLPAISFPHPDIQENTYRNLIGDVVTIVEQFRSYYSRLEDFIEETRLPILPIYAVNSDFDAFLLSHKDRCVVCLNMAKPTGRIHFSLLHEIAHLLFHRDQNLPAAEEVVLTSELYSHRIFDHAKPEFLANKFAQFYLLPLETVFRLDSRALDHERMVEFLQEQRTSREVLCNALYDAALYRGREDWFSAIRDRVQTAIPENPIVDRWLRDFLEARGRELKSQIQAHRDEFGPEVWNRITRAWELNVDV